MKNRAQATLEFTVMFAIMVVLLFGLLGLWKQWCDRIIQRQYDYSRSRVTKENKTINRNIGLGPGISPWPPNTPGSN
jgi:hypothetical protein